MTTHKYQRTIFNHCVYVKNFLSGNFIILLLYIDHILIVSHDAVKIDRLKHELSKSFANKDLDPTQHIIGMKIV